MTMFLVERTFSVGQDQMAEIGKRSRQLTEEEFREITWHHSHVVVTSEGNVKTYCIYEAPDEDVVRRHADKLGWHRVEAIHEIAGDVTPDDFPLT
jgi:Nickel responsive protein SCO4226-like